MKKIVIGTRGSALALYQARRVAKELRESGYNGRIEEKIIQTSGDRYKDLKLTEFAKGKDPLIEKGVFIKELEEALLRSEIHIAVHSLKDLPSTLTEEFEMGAVLERGAVQDLLVTSSESSSLEELPKSATVSTGSVRRSRIVQWKRPDINIKDMRGNVPTRLKKLQNGQYGDATILAQAGLNRLGIYDEKKETLELEGIVFGSFQLPLNEFVPAAGQGAIAIETLTNNPVLEIISKINHQETEECIAVERDFLRLLGAGCDTPVGIHASISPSKDEMNLQAVVFDEMDLFSKPKTGSLVAQRGLVDRVANDLLIQMQINV